MNQNNKRSRDDETNNTSNANKKSKGEDENERQSQEIERLRQEIEGLRQELERKDHKNERQRQEIKLFRHPSKCNKIGYCAKCTQINCMNGRHSDSLPCKHCGEDFSRGQSTLQETIDFLRDWPGEKPKVLDRNEANQWTKDVPEELWLGEIMPYFSVKELSLGGTIAKHFQKYWVTFKTNRKLCVPKDFPSLRDAVRVGQILSRRGIISSTNENLLKIMVSNGVHDGLGDRVSIGYPVSIIGESRDGCEIIGGLHIQGLEEDDVNVSNLTLRDSKGAGVGGGKWKGASFHLDNVSVENSEECGVWVYGAKRNTMKNCNVSHSNRSGLYVYDGLMTIDGNDTTIHHNCTGSIGHYGFHTDGSSASIHLAPSLTIETISKNNGGAGNHGGCGTIKSVDNDGKVLEVVYDGRPDEDEDDE
jgi:parallel beta-helix repeat protein